jgi:hypothetical protein
MCEVSDVQIWYAVAKVGMKVESSYTVGLTGLGPTNFEAPSERWDTVSKK